MKKRTRARIELLEKGMAEVHDAHNRLAALCQSMADEVMTMQRVMGIMPHGSDEDIAARLSRIDLQLSKRRFR